MAQAQTSQVERPASVRTSDSIVYHGKIVRPDGSPVEGSITATIRIFSPEPSRCLLWAESQTLVARKGGFSAELGYPQNRISGVEGGAAQSFREVFINNPGLTISGAQCATGTNYTPGSSEDRLFSAVFQDAGSTVTVDSFALKSVPFAKQAQEIGGYGLANLVKISGTGSNVTLSPDQVNALSVLSFPSTHYDFDFKKASNLADPTSASDAATMGWVQSQISGLGAPTSAQVVAALGYTPQSALGYTPLNKSGDSVAGDFGLADGKHFKLGAFASDPDTTGWANSEKGRSWFNTTTNQVKYWDGSNVQALGVSGAGLTSLNGQSGSTQTFATGTGGTDFGISSSGNTHTFSIPSASGSARGLLTAADWTVFNSKQPAGAYLTAISGTMVTSALGYSPQAALGFAPVDSALPANQTYIGNGSNVAAAGFFGVGQLRNSSGTAQFPASCAASQTLTWSAVTDVFSCSNIGSLPASAITSGTIDSARLPFGASLWQDGTGGKIYYNGGDVGIGTTSPTAKIHVVGSVRSTSTASNVPNSFSFDTVGGDGSNVEFRMTPPGADGSGWPVNSFNLSLNNANDGFIIRSGATERVRFQKDGNVGVGTASPTARFTVKGSDNSGATSSLVVRNGSDASVFSVANDGAGSFSGSLYALQMNSFTFGTLGLDGDVTFKSYSTSRNLVFSAGSTERMRLTGSGNLGIGTPTPGDKLHVEGKIRAQEICDTNGTNCKVISGGWTAGSVTSVGVGGLPLSVVNGSSTPTISIAEANGSQSGYLSSTDWTLFNSKQPAGNYLTSISGSDVHSALGYTPQTALGYTPVNNALPTNQTYIGNGSNVAAAGFFGVGQLRNASGTAQFPASCAASQTLTWSAVTDVFSCSNIGSLPASAITSGTIDSARLPFGASLWQDGSAGKIYYSGGNVGIGTSSPNVTLHVRGTATISNGSSDSIPSSLAAGLPGTFYVSHSGSNYGLVVNRATADAGAPRMTFYKTRATDPATKTAVQASDLLGAISFQGAVDSSNVHEGAYVVSTAESAPTGGGTGVGFVPSALLIGTSNSSTGPVERMRITGAGNVGIGSSVPTARLFVQEAGDVRQLAVREWADISASSGGQALFGANVYRGGSSNDFRYSNTHAGIGAAGVMINYPAWRDISFISDGTNNPSGATTLNTTFTPTTNMIIKTNGNVGIGTTTPGQKLSVVGVIESTTGGIRFPDGTTQTTAATGGGSALTCPTGFTKITNAGATLGCAQNDEAESGTARTWHVGSNYCFTTYGGRMPTALEWYTAMNSQTLLNETDDWEWLSEHAGTDAYPNSFSVAGYSSITANSWAIFSDTYSYRCWIPASGGVGESLWVANAGTASYSAGNVGVGTTSPGRKVEVRDDTNAPRLRISTTQTTGFTGIEFDSNGAFKGALGRWTPNDDLLMYTASDGVNPRIAIQNSSGNVGVGTTNPATKLDVNGTLRFGGSKGYAGYYNVAPYDQAEVGAIGAATSLSLVTNGISRMNITPTGSVGIGTTNPGYKLDVQGGDINASGSVRSAGVALTSDLRFKKDILELDESLKKILSIRGVSYNWRTEEFPERHFNQRQQIGVIAQEIEKEFPELVDTAKDGYKSVNYPALVAPLINAIKELYQQLKSESQDQRNQTSELQRLVLESEMRIRQLEIENSQLKLKSKESEQRAKSLEEYLCQKDSKAPFCP